MRKYIINSIFLCALVAIIVSCQSQEEMDLQNYISSGRSIYQAKCQNCHGEKGEGLNTLAPPLTDTVYLKDNKDKIACIIKNGLDEKITIHGVEYDEKMPAFKELTDYEVAQVMVFITNSFGNNQGFTHYKKIEALLKNCK